MENKLFKVGERRDRLLGKMD